jgi:hypothetical protein
LRKASLYPTVNFVRSQFCGRHQNNAQHSDLTSAASSKRMRTYLVTTGLSVAHIGTNEVGIYNIQTPSKENTPNDFSTDYYTRIMNARKAQQKKQAA